MAQIHTLTEDFTGGFDPGLWSLYVHPNVPATLIDGRIRMAQTSWAPAGAYSWLSSTAGYDLTGSHAMVEVFSTATGFARTELMVRTGDWAQRLQILVLDGKLTVRIINGVEQNFPVAPFDPTLHRFWRIRHDAGADLVFWETSPDAEAWTAHRVEAPPITITDLYLTLGAGTSDPQAAPAQSMFDNVNLEPQPAPDRRQRAFDVRVQAAQIARDRPHLAQADNNEETDYPYVANFSKGLQHDGLGEVDPASYQSLLDALATGTPADFEAIILGPGGKKLTNPQAGLALTLEGPEPQALSMPPAPRIDSPQSSAEMGELYWMALARDVPFIEYSWNGVVQQAAQSLSTEFSDFRGPRAGGAVTTQTVFRGVYPGETVGPYLSQFLLKGTSDPRLPAGQGRSTTDGLITYGDLKIDQRQVTTVPGIDYLVDFPWWLMAQDGADFRGQDAVDTSRRRFVRSLRDLGERVHIDNVADLFFNAALILLHEVPGDQLNGSGVIGRDQEFPFDLMNPYRSYLKQAPFATYGPPHVLSLVWEAMVRALRAVWYQKWFVHRRLRPEELGGRIDNQLNGRRAYPIDGEILTSLQYGMLSPYFPAQWGSFLLPQQFPEGAPTHPAYGAGHATGAGACATILKAFFDEATSIENPVVPTSDGTALLPYTEWDAGQMTVGSELNKLAGNIAIGRNAAGVHWRSDYDQSLLLGERLAIGILQEQSLLFNEGGGFMLTRFDGTCVKIWDGVVTPC